MLPRQEPSAQHTAISETKPCSAPTRRALKVQRVHVEARGAGRQQPLAHHCAQADSVSLQGTCEDGAQGAIEACLTILGHATHVAQAEYTPMPPFRGSIANTLPGRCFHADTCWRRPPNAAGTNHSHTHTLPPLDVKSAHTPSRNTP